MDKVEIKIYQEKELISYLNVAYPLCFILTEPKLTGWYYENFINIYAQYWFDTFFRIDYLDSSRIFGDILDRRSYGIQDICPEEIITFIEKWIQKGFGVNVFVLDEYYLPQRPAYKKEHFIHEILVYGYNKAEELLSVIGYDINGDYKCFTYTYADFYAAFEEGLKRVPDYLVESLQLIKIRHFFKDYKFDLKRFNEEFKNYIYSVPDEKKLYFSLSDESKPIYGILAFDEMCNCLKEKNNKKIDLHFTNIHMYYEHKCVIYKRINKIIELYENPDNTVLKQLIIDYKILVDSAHELRIRWLKQAIKEKSPITEMVYDSNFLYDMGDRFEQLIRKEKELSLLILNELHVIENLAKKGI